MSAPGPLAYRAGRAISRADFAGDVDAIAARLHGAAYVINRCVGRYEFLAAFVGARRARATSLLPGSGAPAVIGELLRAHPDAVPIDDAFVATALAQRRAAVRPAVELDLDDGDGDGDGDDDDVVAITYTSGTTGAPRPHPKTWRALASTARAVAGRLGAGRAMNLVATVPAQHMYGLETSVMFALAAGYAFHDGPAFLPQEIESALAAVPVPRLLVTTPFHLRHLLASGTRDAPHVDAILSATAPLPRELAAAAEARFGAAVHEIYGCTEAGSIATRRTVRDAVWTPLPGVDVDTGLVPARVTAPWLSHAVDLGDRLATDADGCLELLGRDSDVIKVAGKRASLGDLTRRVLELPGVQDAAVFMPSGERDAQRPAALVVAPGADEARLRALLAEQIDPAFIPRPLRLVASLPRDPLGKLPREALVAQLASAPHRAACRVPESHAALDGHFPGNPVVPGVVLIELAATRALGDAARVSAVRNVKFHRPVRPGTDFDLSWSVDGAVVRFRFERDGELLAEGQLTGQAPA